MGAPDIQWKIEATVTCFLTSVDHQGMSIEVLLIKICKRSGNMAVDRLLALPLSQ